MSTSLVVYNRFNNLKNASFMVLGAIIGTLMMVFAFYEIVVLSGNVPVFDAYRIQMIRILQTPAERALVSDLRSEISDLNVKLVVAEGKIAFLEENKLKLEDRIANAMVIEKDLGEVYDNRVHPKLVKAKEYVEEKTGTVVGYTKAVYHKIVD